MNRAQEIVSEMTELLNEFKQIAREKMSDIEYENFRFNTLTYIEPGLTYEHPWVVNGVCPLESVAEDLEEEEESEI